MFESGFSSTGKNVAEDLSEQQKKKIIFTTERCFPFMTNRIDVAKAEKVILSALENAIELVEGRVAVLRTQLDCNPPRINALQSAIQGSVVTMVNEGPLKICEIFLSEEAAHKYDKEQLRILREKMVMFIKMCGFAIKLNKSVITSEYLPFQRMVEEKYVALVEATRRYLEQ